MELTLEEALQKAIEVHKAGQIQEADRLYKAILQAQPNHPDANHNMGVLAGGVGKVQEALLFFKTALEANSSIGQYWLSYIDALIKLDRIVDAKAVLAEVKDKGAKGEAFDQLEQRLNVPNELPTDPSQQQLNSLLEHYQNGGLDDAEKLAVFITNEFPKHQFAWKVLGAVLGQTGRKSEAVDANQTAVALSPQDAIAHYNLGITLQELGRLDDAEASYKQAIALKPDYAEAYSNLGVTIKELGRLEEAASSYTKASFLQPKNPQFYVLRGLTPSLIARQSLASRDDLMKFINYGDWEGSENILRQIFAENPDHIVAHVAEFINLWCIFCQKLINQNVLKNLVPIFINLFVMGERNNDVNELIKHLFERFDIENILKLVKPENKILVYLSYCQYNFLNENFLHSESIAIDNIQKAERLIKVTDTEDLGWLVVRRSLALSRRKDVSKTALTNLISNLVN